jgi:hypothetical protein
MAVRAADPHGFYELLCRTLDRGPPDSLPCHPPNGSATEYDGPDDFQSARKIDNASNLAPELPDRAGGTLQVQASSVVSLLGFPSKRHLQFFDKLLPLGLRKTNDQPDQGRHKASRLLTSRLTPARTSAQIISKL